MLPASLRMRGLATSGLKGINKELIFRGLGSVRANVGKRSVPPTKWIRTMSKPAIQEIHVNSLDQFVAQVCAIESDWHENDWKICWFRGCGANHSLLPGQYRSEYRDDVHNEESTFFEFKQQARGFLNKEQNDWEMYFLMQHYGVPTRLLDWTSNCLIAIYFALLASPETGEPCVWMLNPFLFNKHNSPTWQDGPGILVPPESAGETYKICGGNDSLHWMNYLHPLLFKSDRKTAEDMNGQLGNIERPIAVSPPLLDQRVNAQSSFFTLHGNSRLSIDECCMDCDGSSHQNFIRKFVFSVDTNEILRQLSCFGMTRQRIYPDLGGLGCELRQRLMKEGERK